jgi:hypothetical protein
MTIMAKKEHDGSKQVIDLTGPQGNAFCLLGLASKWMRQLHCIHTKDEKGKVLLLNDKDVQEILTAGDYEHLVEKFDEYFGDYCILLR